MMTRNILTRAQIKYVFGTFKWVTCWASQNNVISSLSILKPFKICLISRHCRCIQRQCPRKPKCCVARQVTVWHTTITEDKREQIMFILALIYRDVYERPPLLRCPYVFGIWVVPNNGGVLAAAIRHQVIHVALPRHIWPPIYNVHTIFFKSRDWQSDTVSACRNSIFEVPHAPFFNMSLRCRESRQYRV